MKEKYPKYFVHKYEQPRKTSVCKYWIDKGNGYITVVYKNGNIQGSMESIESIRNNKFLEVSEEELFFFI